MAKEIGLSQPTKSNSTSVDLPFDPSEFPRETPQHFISANEKDLNEMLSTVGLGDLSQLFGHIDPNSSKHVPLLLYNRNASTPLDVLSLGIQWSSCLP